MFTHRISDPGQACCKVRGDCCGMYRSLVAATIMAASGHLGTGNRVMSVKVP